jgi:hypothetical protein
MCLVVPPRRPYPARWIELPVAVMCVRLITSACHLKARSSGEMAYVLHILTPIEQFQAFEPGDWARNLTFVDNILGWHVAKNAPEIFETCSLVYAIFEHAGRACPSRPLVIDGSKNFRSPQSTRHLYPKFLSNCLQPHYQSLDVLSHPNRPDVSRMNLVIRLSSIQTGVALLGFHSCSTPIPDRGHNALPGVLLDPLLAHQVRNDERNRREYSGRRRAASEEYLLVRCLASSARDHHKDSEE